MFPGKAILQGARREGSPEENDRKWGKETSDGHTVSTYVLTTFRRLGSRIPRRVGPCTGFSRTSVGCRTRRQFHCVAGGGGGEIGGGLGLVTKGDQPKQVSGEASGSSFLDEISTKKTLM